MYSFLYLPSTVEKNFICKYRGNLVHLHSAMSLLHLRFCSAKNRSTVDDMSASTSGSMSVAIISNGAKFPIFIRFFSKHRLKMSRLY